MLRGDETVGLVLLVREVAADGQNASEGEGVGRVELDYVTPRYRDLSVGTFVYRRDSRMADLGLDRLVANDRMLDRDSYFRGVGFRSEGSELVRDVRG